MLGGVNFGGRCSFAKSRPIWPQVQAIYLHSAARSRADRRVISEPINPPSGLGSLQGSMSVQISRWHFLDRQQTALSRLLALFRRGAMSELSPLCEQKQTSMTENSQRKLVSRNNKGSPNAKMGTIKVIKNGPPRLSPLRNITDGRTKKIIQQTWEMGENYVTLIHGHGRNRGISKFVAPCAMTRS